MKIINHSRLALLSASNNAALHNSACQPANEETANENTAPATEEAIVTETATNTENNTHDNNEMAAMSTDTEHMSVTHKAYNDSMVKMHDAMMIGMNYNDPDAAFAQGM